MLLSAGSIFLMILPVLVFVSVYAYRKIYQKNINRALDGENRSNLFEPGQFLVWVGFTVLIILSVINLVKINNLESIISNQNNTIQSIKQDVWNIQSNLYSLQDDFDEYLQSQKLVSDADYKVVGIPNDNQVEYNVTIELNEVETNADVSLVVRYGSQEAIYPLDSDSLVYSINILFDDDQTYDLYILTEGITTKQENLFEIDVENSFKGRFDVNQSGGGYEGLLEWDMMIENQYTGSEDLLIDTVIVKVYQNSVLQDTINKTPNTVFNDELYEYVRIEFTLDDFSESDQIYLDITITDKSGNEYTSIIIIFDEENPA